MRPGGHELRWGGKHSQAGRPRESLGALSARPLLLKLTPSARQHLRRVLIHDQADRDAIASRLMRYPDDRGRDWADIIDFLTMHPDARRQVVRLLAELDAAP